MALYGLKGGGVLLRLAPDEYIVAGSGLVLEFKKQGENKMKSSPALGEDGFASVGGKIGRASCRERVFRAV